jgi:RNA polymerase sigma-70 factor, ECF subfamily
MPAPPNTNPSLFLRLNHAAPAPRELAWEDFERYYAPIIGGFAARLGAKGQDVDDIVQDVLMGFFARSPTFVYDPEKGRFRGYLKVCTYRVIVKRLASNGRLPLQSMETTDEEAFAVEQAWSSVWDREVLALALDEVRKQIGETKAFAAFEMYVIENKPAEDVATSLKMHLNSVYRAKEHVTQMLRERTAAMGDGI